MVTGFLGSARQQVLGVFRSDGKADEGSPLRCAYGLHPVASRHDPRDASGDCRSTGSTASGEPCGRREPTDEFTSPRGWPQHLTSAGTTEARRTKQ